VRSFKTRGRARSGVAHAATGACAGARPNINLDVDRPREQAAYDEAQRARALAAAAPANERAFVDALVTRYSTIPTPT